MLGFAVLDNHAQNTDIAVWLVSLSAQASARPANTNAVVLKCATDDEWLEKFSALIRNRVVVMTGGSELGSMRLNTPPLSVLDFDALRDAVASHQEAITQAVEEYANTAKTKIVRPAFSLPPLLEIPSEDQSSAVQRALQTANYVSAVWGAWLDSEDQRQQRTIQPRTHQTPWIMPERLNSQDIALLPPGFSEIFRPEVLV